VPDPPVSSLLMYTPDQIDFDALSTETLRALALEIDPFIATSALAELSIRDSKVATEASRTLLAETDDRWLRSSAFSQVLDADPAEALDWLAPRLDGLDDESLGMLLTTLADDPTWAPVPAAGAVVEALESRLADPNNGLDGEVAERVLKTFRAQ
jgi:hypothetical protein